MEPDLSFIGTDIDLNDVAALHRSRLIVFVNAFIQKSVKFLNDFSRRAENQILTAEKSLDVIETKLQILEAKLKRLPKNNEQNGLVDERSEEMTISREESSIPQEESLKGTVVQQEQEVVIAVPETPLSNSIPSQCEKYFKMLKMGVPRAAVEQKMISEGLDPVILDTSHQPAQESAKKRRDESDDGGSDSASSFSDSD